jgi:molybdenum cofactor biosynthesis enzyme MoaA
LGNSYLSTKTLESCLKTLGSLDAIEITGGGEPALHSQIEAIIELCTNKTRTQMYSNGVFVERLSRDLLKKLNPLCISRAHYDSAKNKEIMGVDYSEEIFSKGLDVKISAVLFKGGVDSVQEVKNYISWAKGRANKIVFRQLFKDVDYSAEVAAKVVHIAPIVNYFFGVSDLVNPSFEIDGLQVEFETRSCSCENKNFILHADGKLNFSWDNYDIDGGGN